MSCKWFSICHLSADADLNDGYCILHSKNPKKNKQLFSQAVGLHESKSSDFRYMVFPEYYEFVNFDFATARFSHAIFLGGVEFMYCHFTGKTSLFSSSVSGSLRIVHCTFRDFVEFNDMKVSGACYLSQSEFNGAAEFNFVRFGRGIYIYSTKFSGALFFTQAVFMGASEIVIENSNLIELSFINSSILGDLTLRDSNLSGCRLNFEGAEINKSVHLSNLEVSAITCDHAKISGRFKFASVRGDEGVNATYISFNGVSMGSIGKSVFSHVDLSRTSFINSDLESVIFQTPIFASQKGKAVLFDDLSSRSKNAKSLFEREIEPRCKPFRLFEPVFRTKVEGRTVQYLYRSIKQHFISTGNTLLASDFHFREMDTARLNAEGGFSTRMLLRIYSIVSGYNEAPMRALISLAVAIMAAIIIVYLFADGATLSEAVYKVAGVNQPHECAHNVGMAVSPMLELGIWIMRLIILFLISLLGLSIKNSIQR